jgi:hypothetical protein
MSIQKKSQLFTIQDILPNLIAQISSGNTVDQLTIEKRWKELAEFYVDQALYSGFKEGSLYISVNNPARLYQWKLRKQEVLKKLQKHCPEVKNIVFKIGK